MKKVYDRLKSSLIKKCLSDSDKWINWIMECITTATLSMLINEKPWMAFYHESVRHDDQISPISLLYVLNIWKDIFPSVNYEKFWNMNKNS